MNIFGKIIFNKKIEFFILKLGFFVLKFKIVQKNNNQ